MAIVVRRMKAEAEEIAAVIAVDKVTFDDCPYSAEEVLGRLDFDRYPMFVAESEGDIIGFVAFMKVQTLHYKGLWIDLIAVRPEHQGKGIGKALIKAGQVLAESEQVDFQSALVRADNRPSSHAFEHEGYTWEHPFRLYIKS
ncbi:MAG: GNAT family N-acetyltransferase [Clostridia bacterium]|nr:GNAT family N-acetyltransferase [Clostridia bacterium]